MATTSAEAARNGSCAEASGTEPSARKLCHCGQLCERTCYVEHGNWRRVCQPCLALGDVELPASRCRLLLSSRCVGAFSSGRTYFVQWSMDGRVICENVRPFQTMTTSAESDDRLLLLIFATETDTLQCEEALPGLLIPTQPEHRKFQMCSTSKSLCPKINFIGGFEPHSAPTSCTVHLPMRGGRRGAHGARSSAVMQQQQLPQLRQPLLHGQHPAAQHTMLAPLTAVAQPAHAQWIPPNGMLTALPLPMPMSVPQPDVSMGQADVSMPQPAVSMSLSDVSMHNALGPRQPSAARLPLLGASQPMLSSQAVPVCSVYALPTTISQAPTSEGVAALSPDASDPPPRGGSGHFPATKRVRNNESTTSTCTQAAGHGGLPGEHMFDDLTSLLETDELLRLCEDPNDGAARSFPPGDGRPYPPWGPAAAAEAHRPLSLPPGGPLGLAVSIPAAAPGTADGVMADGVMADYGMADGGMAGGTVAAPLATAPLAPLDAAASGRHCLPACTASVSSCELSSASVRGTLLAYGQTLKANGSPMWTVVSDARLKDVVGDFPLGVGELMRLRPRVFKYNGLGGTDTSGRHYVGLIAQEVPPLLAPYCTLRAQLQLRPSDAALTEILMLDHSAFPFVCINALQEHEERLRRVEDLMGLPCPPPSPPPRAHPPLGSAAAGEALTSAAEWAGGKGGKGGQAWLGAPAFQLAAACLVAALAVSSSRREWLREWLPFASHCAARLAAGSPLVLLCCWAALAFAHRALGPRRAARAGCILLVVGCSLWLARWVFALRPLRASTLTAIGGGGGGGGGRMRMDRWAQRVEGGAPGIRSFLGAGWLALLYDAMDLGESAGLALTAGGDAAEAIVASVCLGLWLGSRPSEHLPLRLKLLTAGISEPLRVAGAAFASYHAHHRSSQPDGGAPAVSYSRPMPMALYFGGGTMEIMTSGGGRWPWLLTCTSLPFVATFALTLVAEKLAFQQSLLRRLAWHLRSLEAAHRELLGSLHHSTGRSDTAEHAQKPGR